MKPLKIYDETGLKKIPYLESIFPRPEILFFNKDSIFLILDPFFRFLVGRFFFAPVLTETSKFSKKSFPKALFKPIFDRAKFSFF